MCKAGLLTSSKTDSLPIRFGEKWHSAVFVIEVTAAETVPDLHRYSLLKLPFGACYLCCKTNEILYDLQDLIVVNQEGTYNLLQQLISGKPLLNRFEC